MRFIFFKKYLKTHTRRTLFESLRILMKSVKEVQFRINKIYSNKILALEKK